VLDDGRYTRFDAPAGATVFLPLDLNDRGQVLTSASTDGGATFHGYLLRNGIRGPYTTIDFPGAPATLAIGLNNGGDIVGAYQNPDVAPAAPMEMPGLSN
jgi:hypothetical protein